MSEEDDSLGEVGSILNCPKCGAKYGHLDIEASLHMKEEADGHLATNHTGKAFCTDCEHSWELSEDDCITLIKDAFWL